MSIWLSSGRTVALSSDEDYGQWYERMMREQHGDQRIHVECAWVLPTDLRPGAWVMYLPLEVTNQAGMVPRMARVTRIRFEKGVYQVETDNGLMQFRPGERVQEVV